MTRFDSFAGDMDLTTDKGSVSLRIDGKSLLMRETNLRNCPFIFGLVVYAGNDTKIQRSNLEGGKVLQVTDSFVCLFLFSQVGIV